MRKILIHLSPNNKLRGTMIGKFNNGIFEVIDWKKLVEDSSAVTSVHDRDIIKNEIYNQQNTISAPHRYFLTYSYLQKAQKSTENQKEVKGGNES